ncbi:MAG: SDR family oxidoreductase [Chlorobi bacterium]|jgi:NAD(P)-dependent dehydrogenase (short-subunit alcohol dehydrogenase family)|nr:SDR family oxidoreductase [Chlorobiota bacterium]
MEAAVLITGASGGLGKHVVRAFASRRWQILATVLNEDERRQLGDVHDCVTFECDVTDPNAVAELARVLPENLHAVVHLVGGIRAGRLIEETSPDDFGFMWKLNALSTYLVMHATLPILKRNAGAFVAVAAKTVLHVEPRKALYGAAKAAVAHLVLAAAEEGRAEGLRANVILPSIIRTDANLEWARPGEEQSWVPPSDIADVIAFLCSDEGRGVTGCLIPMYGKLPA